MEMRFLNKKAIVIVPRRKAKPTNIWFDLFIDGEKYSLLDCGALMKTSPFPLPQGIFMGWETLRDKNGGQEIKRAETLDELLEIITK
jgi:hypothetical protein